MNLKRTQADAMQGARRDAVRAGPPLRLLAAGNAAARRLGQLENTIIYWYLLSWTFPIFELGRRERKPKRVVTG